MRIATVANTESRVGQTGDKRSTSSTFFPRISSYLHGAASASFGTRFYESSCKLFSCVIIWSLNRCCSLLAFYSGRYSVCH